jgi:hypothetical protein
MNLDYRENPCGSEQCSMTRDQILNYGHYMTVGHGCTSIVLLMGCQEKSAGHRKYFAWVFSSDFSA